MKERSKPCPECEEWECPWWDFNAWDCCKITGAHVSEPLKTRAEILDAMAKSETVTNLDKKTAAGAGDTNDGKETQHDA